LVISCCVVSALGGFAFLQLSAPSASHAGVHPAPPPAVTHVDTARRVVALTFDDGPDPRWTPLVLDQLARHHATATFFVVGRNAEAHTDLVAAELAHRDEIGDHTWSHADLSRLTNGEIEAEIERGATAIQAAGAPKPYLFRPPKGRSNHAVAVIAGAQGYTTVLWDQSFEHYVNHGADAAAAVAEILERVTPGSIILAHDGGIPDRSRTMSALPLLLDGLVERGYDVVDVSQLLAVRRSPPAKG